MALRHLGDGAPAAGGRRSGDPEMALRLPGDGALALAEWKQIIRVLLEVILLTYEAGLS